ncbi:Tyrosine-protein kinase YwqD [compost metagenome]
MPGEGKSWTSSNLAVTFAQAGKKVVLVDADMRKGRQYSIFDGKPRPGLSNFLSGIDQEDNSLPVLVQATEVDNLFIIATGDVPPNPAELLISDKMDELISQLKEVADIIIFDAPPGLVVTDAAILSRYVDSTIIVTAANDTKMEALEKVKKAIENVGGKVSGVVINKVPMNTRKYGYYGNYYGSTATFKKGRGKNKHHLAMSQREAARPENQPKREVKTGFDEIYAFKQREEELKDITKDSISVDKAQDVLNQINTYLSEEKKKLKGDS